MAIKIIQNSKDAIMRCRTKSDYAETYCFGHNSCNSGLFLLKMGLKCANFKGYYLRNRLQSVQIGPVALFEKHATTTAGLVLICPVQFSFRSFFSCMDQTCRHYFQPSKRLKKQRRHPKFNSKCKCLALSSQYQTTDRQGERVRH